jgi:hypothetical protein
MHTLFDSATSRSDVLLLRVCISFLTFLTTGHGWTNLAFCQMARRVMKWEIDWRDSSPGVLEFCTGLSKMGSFIHLICGLVSPNILMTYLPFTFFSHGPWDR